MDKKERYIVSTMDGKTHIIVANTFGEVIQMLGEDNIWQMTKAYFDEKEIQKM